MHCGAHLEVVLGNRPDEGEVVLKRRLQGADRVAERASGSVTAEEPTAPKTVGAVVGDRFSYVNTEALRSKNDKDGWSSTDRAVPVSGLQATRLSTG